VREATARGREHPAAYFFRCTPPRSGLVQRALRKPLHGCRLAFVPHGRWRKGSFEVGSRHQLHMVGTEARSLANSVESDFYPSSPAAKSIVRRSLPELEALYSTSLLQEPTPAFSTLSTCLPRGTSRIHFPNSGNSPTFRPSSVIAPPASEDGPTRLTSTSRPPEQTFRFGSEKALVSRAVHVI
jgi:hypothetical protein